LTPSGEPGYPPAIGDRGNGVTCSRCGEDIPASEQPHQSVEDCLAALRFVVAGLSRYVARAELEAATARHEVQVLRTLLQRIADVARPEASPTVLPSLMRRIRKLAADPCAKGKSNAA
jgi:hypothetical protein